MGCHAPSEDMEDDDREFLAAARGDDALVANLLIRLSRSDTRTAWRLPLEVSRPPSPPLPPAAGTWGRRRARSTSGAAEGAAPPPKREGSGRASPSTPLSWSGASGTSGSGSEDGWPSQTRAPKRSVHEHGESSQPPQSASKRKAEARHGGGEQIGDPAAKGTTAGMSEKGETVRVPGGKWGSREDRELHGGSVVLSPAAVGSPAGSGSNKVIAVAVAAKAPPRSIGHLEPLRSRSTGEGRNSMVFGRQGKKKTVLELRVMKESLFQEQQELHKELAKQKEIYNALLEENAALKKLESNLPSVTASKTTVTLVVCGEAKHEEPHHLQPTSEWQTRKGTSTAHVVHDEGRPKQPQCKSSSSPASGRTFLFDLNCPPDNDL